MDNITEVKRLLNEFDSKHSVSISDTEQNINDISERIVKLFSLPVVKNCGVLEKAKQMQKEQKYIYDECDGNYEENTIYQHGVLHGIDRIVKLIERHCS